MNRESSRGYRRRHARQFRPGPGDPGRMATPGRGAGADRRGLALAARAAARARARDPWRPHRQGRPRTRAHLTIEPARTPICTGGAETKREESAGVDCTFWAGTTVHAEGSPPQSHRSPSATPAELRKEAEDVQARTGTPSPPAPRRKPTPAGAGGALDRSRQARAGMSTRGRGRGHIAIGLTA